MTASVRQRDSCDGSSADRRIALICAPACLNSRDTDGNHIDARKYRVTDTVCRNLGDPTRWTGHVNDQAICIGWAGYDEKVDWLPIEHWLAREFRDALNASCKRGRLKGQGPDGKLLVRVREEGDRWQLEHVLVTLQQRPETSFLDLCAGIAATLEEGRRGSRFPRPRVAAHRGTTTYR